VTGRAVIAGRLRRRLAIAFVLAVGSATAALALGSYLIVRSSRLDDSASRAVSQSRFNLGFAQTEASTSALLAAYRTRGEFCTVVVPAAGGALRSAANCPTPRQVPAGMRRLIEQGRLVRQRITLAGRHLIAVGGIVPGRHEYLVFFYDEQQVWDDLATLRDVLAGGWLLLTVLAGLAGTLLARRTLAPVAQASDAARSLAEGLLDTRLPVTGDDEFAAWAASFNEMAEALESKIDALSQAEQRERMFTANVAHELRTPLTALVGEAQLLADRAGELPPESARLAELLLADVGRLHRLTDDLLEISRLDAGSEHTETQLLDAAAVVTAVVRGQGWAEQVALQTEPCLVSTDRRRLERIVANLVGNALHHGGSGVRVQVCPAPGQIAIVVSDSGPGIDPEFLPRVFDRFSKADRSRSGHGSGLGLAIAAENARLLGGAIAADSRPGQGAVFTLTLPVAQPLPGGEAPVARVADAGEHEHEEE
jgi:two-component system, OmpR family, sensor histidine kinase MtrB